METNQQQIDKIAQQEDYAKIHDDLKSAGLLDNHVLELRQKYAELFKTKDFEPEQKLWEMMAIEDLYDTNTFEHSERTFEITNEIITKPLIGPHGETILVKDILEESGISPYQVKAAAIGHDIGKLKIPKEILHNTLTDDEMYRILIDMLHRGVLKKEIIEKLDFESGEGETKSDEEVLSQLHSQGLRAVSMVPISEAFPDKTEEELAEILSRQGVSPEQTIRQFIAIHEEAGQKIFEDMNEPIIADLVGHHHNYEKKKEHEMKYKIKIPALHVDGLNDEFGIYNIIKIADMMDSLQSARSYKKAMTKLSAFAELIRQIKVIWPEKRILYLWIDNEFREWKETNPTNEVPPEEKQNVEKIEAFLAETKMIFK